MFKKETTFLLTMIITICLMIGVIISLSLTQIYSNEIVKNDKQITEIEQKIALINDEINKYNIYTKQDFDASPKEVQETYSHLFSERASQNKKMTLLDERNIKLDKNIIPLLKKLAIIFGTIGGGFLIVIIVLFVLFYLQKSKKSISL